MNQLNQMRRVSAAIGAAVGAAANQLLQRAAYAARLSDPFEKMLERAPKSIIRLKKAVDAGKLVAKTQHVGLNEDVMPAYLAGDAASEIYNDLFESVAYAEALQGYDRSQCYDKMGDLIVDGLTLLLDYELASPTVGQNFLKTLRLLAKSHNGERQLIKQSSPFEQKLCNFFFEALISMHEARTDRLGNQDVFLIQTLCADHMCGGNNQKRYPPALHETLAQVFGFAYAGMTDEQRQSLRHELSRGLYPTNLKQKLSENMHEAQVLILSVALQAHPK